MLQTVVSGVSKISKAHIDATKLLHGLRASAKKQSSNSLSPSLSTSAEEITPFDGILTFILDTVYDLFSLGDNVRIVNRLIFQVGQYFTGFGFVPMSKQPSIINVRCLLGYWIDQHGGFAVARRRTWVILATTGPCRRE